MICDHTLSELFDLRRRSFLQGELPHLDLSQSSLGRFCCKGLVSAGQGSQRRYCTEQTNSGDCRDDHPHKRILLSFVIKSCPTGTRSRVPPRRCKWDAPAHTEEAAQWCRCC